MLLYANISQNIYAQTTLSTGDLMIIGLNADGGTVNEISGEGTADEFLFILLEPVAAGTQIYFTDFGYIGNTYPFFQTNFNTGQCVSTPLSGNRGDVSSGLIRWNATSNLPAMTKVLVRVGPNVLVTSEGTVTSIVATQTVGTPMSLTSSGETLHAFQGVLDVNNEPSSVTMLSAFRYRTSWEAPTWECHYTPSISGNPNTGFDVVHTANPDNAFYTGSFVGAKSTIQNNIKDITKWELNTTAGIDFFPEPAPVIARTVSFETPTWPDASSGQVEINPASQIDGLYRFTSSTKMFINGNAATEGTQSFWPTEFVSGESFTIATTTGEEFDFQQIKVDVYDSAAFFGSAEGFRDGVSTGVQTTGVGFTHYPVNSGVYTISFTNSIFDNVDSVKVNSSGLFGISINVYDEAVFQDPTLLPPGPSVAITSSTNPECNGASTGSLTATVTGGTSNYNYVWSNGSSTLNTSSLTNTITSLSAGNYKIVVTDNNGLKDSTDITLTEPTVLVAGASVDSNVSCNTFLDGGATASASGGTEPYSYAWSNSAITASITGVAAGTYNVTVTDAMGCTSNSSVTITEPTVLVASSSVDSNVSCNTFLDGGATASASGGTEPYSYAWSNSAITASITGVAAGTYNVTVTDAMGCTSSSSVTITEPELSESTDTVKAIDSYEWIDGVTYTETTFGSTHTLTDINGCDSIITLDLTIINYCASRSTRNRFEWIKEVKIEDDIDNLSNANSGGYGDYTDQLLTVDTGDVVTVTLTPGYKRRVYEEYWRIWADWNYDGDFNDPGEKVFEKKGKNVQTGTFTIPVNVDVQELGLRVSMRWKRYAPSCGNYSSGEVEDYRIKVNGAQGYVNLLPGRLMQGDNIELTDTEVYEFIDVYPNPVNQGEFITGFIRIEQTGEKQLQIVNTLGQIVKTESITCDEEENRFEISTQGLSKGIYFINISSGHDVMKVLVQ